jgi:hypothetical protein
MSVPKNYRGSNIYPESTYQSSLISSLMNLVNANVAIRPCCFSYQEEEGVTELILHGISSSHKLARLAGRTTQPNNWDSQNSITLLLLCLSYSVDVTQGL